MLCERAKVSQACFVLMSRFKQQYQVGSTVQVSYTHCKQQNNYRAPVCWRNPGPYSKDACTSVAQADLKHPTLLLSDSNTSTLSSPASAYVHPVPADHLLDKLLVTRC